MFNAKVIYLARRNPAIAKEAFPERWRQHSAFGRPLIKRSEMGYNTVCYCLIEEDTDGAVDPSGPYDAVCLMHLEGLHSIGPAIRRANHVLLAPEVAADELRTFDRYVKDAKLFCAFEPVLNGPETEWCVLLMMSRIADISPTAFLRQTRGSMQSLLALPEVIEHVTRVVQHSVLVRPERDFDYDVAQEYWFDSHAAMVAGSAAIGRQIADPAHAAIRTRRLAGSLIMNKRFAPDLG